MKEGSDTGKEITSEPFKAGLNQSYFLWTKDKVSSRKIQHLISETFMISPHWTCRAALTYLLNLLTEQIILALGQAQKAFEHFFIWSNPYKVFFLQNFGLCFFTDLKITQAGYLKINFDYRQSTSCLRANPQAWVWAQHISTLVMLLPDVDPEPQLKV